VGFSDNWGVAPDSAMMTELLEAIGEGKAGALDPARLYATGISSGGYMTSRMAVSYAGKFRALAVHSASYATCAGSLCSVPELPADHPPTLLVHGEKDSIVPISSMRAYEEKLQGQGLKVETEISAEGGHEWLEASVTRIPAWFDAHP
jgi:predicted esterase